MNSSLADQKSLSEVNATVDATSKKAGENYGLFWGPAYLVSVGYMDPGNWATDIAGGSQFGYTLIWVLLMSNLMALLLQNLSARLGIVRKMDLAQASRSEYRPGINKMLWVLAEIAIAATDLAEVLGMAIGLQLLFGIPLLWGVSLTVLDTLLLLLLQSYGMRKIEVFIVGLVVIIGGAFFIEMMLAKPDIGELAMGFIPSLPNDTALYIAIGIIGATVMPHNLYLHSALVQTRRIETNKKGIWSAIRYNFIDSAIALNAAFFVNAAILILAGSTFFQVGLYEVSEIQDAHKLLASLLGTELAPLLFGIALVAAGQSSTITSTLAGQVVMEGHLNLRIAPWMRRLLTRMVAIIPAFLVIAFYGEAQTGKLLILSQVILSLQLGFATIPLIHFTSDKSKMGAFTNTIWVQSLAWLIALVIVGLNIQLVVQEVAGWLTSAAENAWMVWVAVVPACSATGILLLYIIFKPFIEKRRAAAAVRIPHGGAIKMEHWKQPIYRRIAIAIDFSNIDTLAIQSALAQGRHEAEYLLIHIVESVGAMVYGGRIADRESRMDTEALTQYADQLKTQGYTVEAKVGFGNPRRKIPTMVKEFNADLLVMGGHGHTLIKDLIFGTTVSTVRHRIDIPIFIVKKSD